MIVAFSISSSSSPVCIEHRIPFSQNCSWISSANKRSGATYTPLAAWAKICKLWYVLPEFVGPTWMIKWRFIARASGYMSAGFEGIFSLTTALIISVSSFFACANFSSDNDASTSPISFGRIKLSIHEFNLPKVSASTCSVVKLFCFWSCFLNAASFFSCTEYFWRGFFAYQSSICSGVNAYTSVALYNFFVKDLP